MYPKFYFISNLFYAVFIACSRLKMRITVEQPSVMSWDYFAIYRNWTPLWDDVERALLFIKLLW